MKTEPVRSSSLAWARKRLLFASVLTAAWIAFLTAQVLATANPVILSRHQMLGAELIVEGTLAAADRLRVTQVWLGDAALAGEDLKLREPSSLPIGTALIAPLEETVDGYIPFPPPTGFDRRDPEAEPPRLYPATDLARRQLAALLEWRRKRPAGDADE